MTIFGRKESHQPDFVVLGPWPGYFVWPTISADMHYSTTQPQRASPERLQLSISAHMICECGGLELAMQPRGGAQTEFLLVHVCMSFLAYGLAGSCPQANEGV